jgi:hypothetical protein
MFCVMKAERAYDIALAEIDGLLVEGAGLRAVAQADQIMRGPGLEVLSCDGLGHTGHNQERCITTL